MIQIICAFKILAIDLLSKRLVLILHGGVLVAYIASFRFVQQLLLVLRRISVVLVLVVLVAVSFHGLGRWIQAPRLLKGIEFISLRLNREGLAVALRYRQIEQLPLLTKLSLVIREVSTLRGIAWRL